MPLRDSDRNLGASGAARRTGLSGAPLRSGPAIGPSVLNRGPDGGAAPHPSNPLRGLRQGPVTKEALINSIEH
jgi:hypothetical protein